MNGHLKLITVMATFLVGMLGVSVVIDSLARAESSGPAIGAIDVNTLDDELNGDGDCSLREAITAANGNTATEACPPGDGASTDTITFAVSGTIQLTAPMTVTAGGPLVINGGGAVTVSGGNSVRIFYVNYSADLTLESLFLTSGSADYGGGVYNAGNLTVSNSTLSDNSAYTSGGGIFNVQRATIMSSTLSGNSALSGGGIYNDFVLSISSSTLSGNSASQNGGGIYNDGSAWLTNSTLSGNSASSRGGGIYASDTAGLTASSSTLSSNSAGSEGGGIYTLRWVTLRNTILANNSSGNLGPDCMGNFGSDGYNLIGDTEGCTGLFGPGDLTNVDAKLGPLQDNGGPTHTQALLPGSLAINGGNPDGCKDSPGTLLSTDQRGFPRSGRCDIGAYEWQPATPGPHVIYLPFVSRSCPTKLFYDDFSNPSSGWPVGENQHVRFEYLNNEYRILVKSTGLWAGARPGFKASDYVAVVDVRNATGVDATYGIIFGLSDDWTQFYAFEILPYSNYRIYRVDSNNWILLAAGLSGSIHPGTATNQLKIERNGSQIWAYANGELLNIINDGNYTGLRHVGLFAISYAQPNVDVRFDNFTLYPITCGASGASLSKEGGLVEVQGMEFDLLKNWASNHHRSMTGK